MPTPHNNAEKGDFAKTVLMPGDPLRAKFIAETFLEDVRLVTNVRNVPGYTGKYHSKPVSVMASGMGMPSIGIYSYELFRFYDVENIIRVGSAGAYSDQLHIYDLFLTTSAYSESTYASVQSGKEISDTLFPSEALNKRLREAAEANGFSLHEGMTHSSDVFYRENDDYLHDVRDVRGCAVVEMESYALFHNAAVLNRNAACILTVSDSFVYPEQTTPEEREQSFTAMMTIALEAAI